MESTLRNLLIQFDTRKFSDVLGKIKSVEKYNYYKKRNLTYYGFLGAIVLPRNVILALDFVVLCYGHLFAERWQHFWVLFMIHEKAVIVHEICPFVDIFGLRLISAFKTFITNWKIGYSSMVYSPILCRGRW